MLTKLCKLVNHRIFEISGKNDHVWSKSTIIMRTKEIWLAIIWSLLDQKRTQIGKIAFKSPISSFFFLGLIGVSNGFANVLGSSTWAELYGVKFIGFRKASVVAPKDLSVVNHRHRCEVQSHLRLQLSRSSQNLPSGSHKRRSRWRPPYTLTPNTFPTKLVCDQPSPFLPGLENVALVVDLWKVKGSKCSQDGTNDQAVVEETLQGAWSLHDPEPER